MASVIDVFAIAVGCLVFGMWAASLATHNVPELVTAPWEIRLHISAESIMALTLIGGGVASLLGVAEGPPIVLLGLGMTIYSIVNSSGYFLQRRQLPPTLMFAVLLVLTGLAAAGQVSLLAR